MSLRTSEYRTQEEIQNLHAAGMEERIGQLQELLDGKPKLTATFELSAMPGCRRVDGLATSVLDLDTARPVNAGAKKIASIIDPSMPYGTDDKILLGIAFDHAADMGRKIEYRQKENGRVLASIGPKP